jgi:hypothetical protein
MKRALALSVRPLFELVYTQSYTQDKLTIMCRSSYDVSVFVANWNIPANFSEVPNYHMSWAPVQQF